MKRILLLLVLSVAVFLNVGCSFYSVYSAKSKPSMSIPGGMVYALPHTQLRIAVTFEKRDLENAPYAEFAADLIGMKVAIDSVYSIKSIDIQAVNQADPQSYYFVNPRWTSLSVDSRNLLMAIGCDPLSMVDSDEESDQPQSKTKKAVSQASYNLYDRVDTFYTRFDKPGKPTLLSSRKDVRPIKQRATQAAERLEEVQEKKQQLLFGEFGGNYSGDAVRFLYDQLTEQEESIIAQFVGYSTTETVVFWVDPRDEKSLVDSQTVELFRFTPTKGLVDSTEAEALVVYCNIQSEHQLKNASRFMKNRTSKINSGNLFDRRKFKYRIPETARVTLYGQSKNQEVEFFFQKKVKISQFGTTVNLPMGRYHAQFDPNTGDLIHFSR